MFYLIIGHKESNDTKITLMMVATRTAFPIELEYYS